jgi:phenylpyruvate tautomerase PptA (4-oxalocrotonate tautomerase family)
MPLYEIHHSCPLSTAQQQALATGITTLHCTTFSAPSAFVNITFHPTSVLSPQIYVGGVPQRTNYILGHLRPRPNNAAKQAHIVTTLTSLWNEHARPLNSVLGQVGEKVGLGYKAKSGDGRLDDERALHNVFIMEDIVAGAEQGFALPVAGRDGEWASANMAEFERRAADGDESMRSLVREYKAKL